MSKLTGKQRKALPKSDFVFPDKAPGSGSHPISDTAHAKVAKAYASKEESEGKMSKAQEDKVDKKADAKLDKTHSKVREHKRVIATKTVTVKAHHRKKHKGKGK